MDCSLPGSSVHGVLQANILEWVAIYSSRGSSWPKDWIHVSCFAREFFTVWATRKALGSSIDRGNPGKTSLAKWSLKHRKNLTSRKKPQPEGSWRTRALWWERNWWVREWLSKASLEEVGVRQSWRRGRGWTVPKLDSSSYAAEVTPALLLPDPSSPLTHPVSLPPSPRGALPTQLSSPLSLVSLSLGEKKRNWHSSMCTYVTMRKRMARWETWRIFFPIYWSS